jgi:hypothetical protein
LQEIAIHYRKLNMTNNAERSADHLLSLKPLIPWKNIADLVSYLRRVEDTLDDGSNFGRVDAMSVSVAADILESLGKPSVGVMAKAVKIAAREREDWGQGDVPEALIETAHLAALEAMLTTYSEIGARKTFWPAPVYDAWRQCHKIADHAYSEDQANANLIVENVNAYIAAGEPYIADDDKGRLEIWKLLGQDVWFIDDVGFSDDETKANLISAAFAWRSEMSKAA